MDQMEEKRMEGLLDRDKMYAVIKKVSPEKAEKICKDFDNFLDGKDEISEELAVIFSVLEEACEGDADNLPEVLDRIAQEEEDGKSAI